MREYLNTKLLRKCIVVSDIPGFLANRIGFQFINESLIYSELYQDLGGISFMDNVLGKYTGRNMTPNQTAEFVGLDIHKAIVDNIYNNQINDPYIETFKLPNFVNNCITNGNLGRKTGKGLYERISREEIKQYNLANNIYESIFNNNDNYIDTVISLIEDGLYDKAYEVIKNNNSLASNLSIKMLLAYSCYSLYLSNLHAESIHDADIVMAHGFNWIPPLAVVDLFGGKNNFIEMCEYYLESDKYEFLYEIEDFTDNIKSKFNYKTFIKAKR